jgi:hypothetical protein
MPIINRHDSYYLAPNQAPVIRPAIAGAGFMLYNYYDFSDKNYWHVACFDGRSLLQLKEIIPDHILQEIQNNNIILSIGAEYEHFNSIPETIYDFLIKELSIPAESILLLIGNANIDKIVDEISSSRNLPKIQTKWVCVGEKMVSFHINKPLDTLQIKPYPKKYMSLNRRWRTCRLALVAYLKAKNLLDHGFVSLQSFEGKNWDNSWDSMIRFQDHETKELFEQCKDEIINLPNLKLDNTNLDDMNPVIPDLDEYYLNSYFSIVGGGGFYEKETPNLSGLCEKTFKAIQKKHPFILLHPANNLPLLHGMGYKTFDGLIDESYDRETDDNKRMRMIVAEIERLCNLSGEELENFLVEAKKIVDHNFKNLYCRALLPII